MKPINPNVGAQYQLLVAVGEDDKLYPAMPTLRDQFAMASLQGMLSWDSKVTSANDVHNIARLSYQYADAMLKVRAGEQE